MIRKLKALGLGLVMIGALSALSASSASGQQAKLTSDGPVTLTGAETGALLSNSLTAPIGSITCDGSTFTGHTYSITPGERLVSGETTWTITPHYATHCTVHIPILGTRQATVTMNGCDYVLHSGFTTGGGAGTFSVTADVICHPEKEIEVDIYKVGTAQNHVAHTNTENILCRIRIPGKNNAGLQGAHLTNGSGDFNITGTFEDIYTTHEGSLCGSGENETADLDVDITVKGHNSTGGETQVSISH